MRLKIISCLIVLIFSVNVYAYELVLSDDMEYTGYSQHFMERHWGTPTQSYWDEFKAEITRSTLTPHSGSYSMTYDPFLTGNPHATMLFDSTATGSNTSDIIGEDIFKQRWYFRWYHRWETGITWGGTLNKAIHVNQNSNNQGTSLTVVREGSTVFHITLYNYGTIIVNVWRNTAQTMDDMEWHKMELYMDYGTNNSDAELFFKFDDVIIYSASGLSMTNIDTNPVKFMNDWPGNISGSAPTGTANQWLDDFEMYTLDSSTDIPPESGVTDPTIEMSGSGTTVEVDTPVVMHGVATAVSGRTISGATSSPSVTWTCDDGTCDEQVEAMSGTSNTLSEGLNSYVVTVEDDQSDTGQDTFTITYTPSTESCDADHYWLCETQTPCEDESFYWWDGACRTITEPTDWSGDNMLSNGDFSAWTSGDPDDWSVENNSNVVEDPAGVRLFSAGTISQNNPPLVDNYTYRYVANIVTITDGEFEVYYYNTAALYDTVGTVTGIFTIGEVPDHSMYFKAPSESNDVTVNNIVLREVVQTNGGSSECYAGSSSVGSTGSSSVGSAQ